MHLVTEGLISSRIRFTYVSVLSFANPTTLGGLIWIPMRWPTSSKHRENSFACARFRSVATRSQVSIFTGTSTSLPSCLPQSHCGLVAKFERPSMILSGSMTRPSIISGLGANASPHSFRTLDACSLPSNSVVSFYYEIATLTIYH